MKKLIPAMFALVLILVGCGQTVPVEVEKYLEPLTKNDKVPPLSDPQEITVPFIVNAQWAADLSKYVPLYGEPQFLTEKEFGKPGVFQNELTNEVTDIDAQSYHHADPREVFEWMSKNYEKYGYKLNTGAKRDALVWIAGDEHGYFLLLDQDKSMEIQVWKLDAYPGWTKVVYQGSTRKDCNCTKKN